MTTTVGGGAYTNIGRWANADADGVGTANKFLGVILQGSTANDQERSFVVDGLVTVPTNLIQNKPATETNALGIPLYLSPTAGNFDVVAPTSSGQIVRIVGHVVAVSQGQWWTILFRPDGTWIEI
jgi:hypothetical protein